MKTASLLILLLFLFCAGCALMPTPGGTPSETGPQAQQLFLKGLDELTATGTSPSFAVLRRQYPHSPWTTRADEVASLCAKPADRLKRLKGELQQCSRDKTHLNEQIKHLKEDLDKLKQILIEMEMRAN